MIRVLRAAICVLLFLYSMDVSAATISKPTNFLGMVGYYTFDGADMTPNVRDRSGSGNHANLSAATATTTVLGKSGQAFSFDGVDDYVRIVENSSIDVASGGQISVSAWVRTNDPYGCFIALRSNSNNQTIFSLCAGYNGVGTNAGHLMLAARCDNGNGCLSTISTTQRIDDGAWHFVVATLNQATNEYFAYVDGARYSGSFNTDGPFSFNTEIDLGSEQNWVRTGWSTQDNQYHRSQLDDVRIFNRALSQAEIGAVYSLGGAKLTKSNQSPGTLANGLVGHWTFDGPDMAPNVRDRSGQAAHGNLTGQTSTTTGPGKIGQAIRLDGVNDYVAMGDVADATELTIAAWVYPKRIATDQRIVSKWTNTSATWQYLLSTDDTSANEFSFAIATAGGTRICDSNSSVGTYTADQWYFVTGTYDGTTCKIYVNAVDATETSGSSGPIKTSTVTLNIGAEASPVGNYFSGMIDDVRIYSRSLSASEVTQLYALGGSKINTQQNQTRGSLDSGLLGLWSFDGPDVTDKVYDRSGNGNHGYFTSGATSSAKTLGKVGQALKFFGDNVGLTMGDVEALDGVSQMSVGLWVKTAADGFYMFAGKLPSGAAGWDIQTETGSAAANKQVKFLFYPSGSSGITSSILTSNEWHHIVAVFDGTQSDNVSRLKIYVNGAEQSLTYSGTVPAAMTSSAAHLRFASWTGGTAPYSGTLDEARIYSRALTAQEVKQLYNSGR